jgi:hypothetical protein
LSYDLSEAPALAVLVSDDVRSWDRRFDQIKKRYRDFAGIALSGLPSWDQVLSLTFADAVITQLLTAATEVRQAVDRARSK